MKTTTTRQRITPIIHPALMLALFGVSACADHDTSQQRTELSVPEPLCENLSEDECVDAGCQPVYRGDACACPDCPEGAMCEPCHCEPPEFAGCVDPRPTDACEALSERQCHNRPDCDALYSACACAACAPGEACPPCDCPAEPQFEGCFSRGDECSGLDERSCHASPHCEANYGPLPCPAIACAPDQDDCDVSCDDFGFVGCSVEENCECEPVTCRLYCEYGFQTDAHGCEICACNEPPPDLCEDLSERECRGAAFCEPVYEWTPDGQRHYRSCEDTGDACARLSEDECLDRAPYCEAEYGPTVCPGCRPGEMCPPCEEGGFIACHESRPTCEPVACDLWCEYGFQTDESGCEVCACNPPPNSCEGLSELECRSSATCAPIYVGEGCVCPDGDVCAADDPNCGACACPEPTERYAGCAPVQPDRCEDLDEQMCIAIDECRPVYASDPCPQPPPCRPGEMCDEPVDCATEARFVGCEQDGDICPPIPAIWCEWGNEIDENGCATGVCLPPPCEDLEEERCRMAEQEVLCRAVYDQQGRFRVCR